MIGAYLDTSALYSLVFQDNRYPALRRWTTGTVNAITTSDFSRVEFASAVAKNVRMRLLSEQLAIRGLANLDRLIETSLATLVRMTEDDIAAAYAILIRFELKQRTGDALQLAICQRLGLDLISFDHVQRITARGIGVGVVDLFL